MSTSKRIRTSDSHRRSSDQAVRAAAALLIAGALAEAAPAAADWLPGNPFILGTFHDNQWLDIDGNGDLDFEIQFNAGYGGTTIGIVPLVVDGINNRVHGEFGQATYFPAADDILTAPLVTIAAPDWADLTAPFSGNPGHVGLIFHSAGFPTAPGSGAPMSGFDYYGYLQVEILADSITIMAGGYQPFPTQGAVPIDPRPGLALRVLPARPGAHTGLSIELTLPSAAPASLQLIDIQGRRLVGRDLSTLGAGVHRVELSPPTRLPAGSYIVRLVQGSEARTLRTVIAH